MKHTFETFKTLPLMTAFEFESAYTMPLSGMARGPWIKTGFRTYAKQGDPQFRCKVGSINVGVTRVVLPETVR